ncbi:hypothetical protein HN51_030597 [Arachis hypogaea]|uniref:Ubiquitin-like protease family profile domain-containing protein n=1 Tax=Arachis hypogaea TaxID=3818 RepID=A0A445BAL8_ARAHY|nr:probable ubiquitin-like-specific protease 2A [Arachis hypogaea]QHO15106.1 putative ubiquitin-like-specific protease 2A [Arachis hypogaea]RYR35738.1 hypothetical protein Ahy_A10g050858 [Arachis hypogaea]
MTRRTRSSSSSAASSSKFDVFEFGGDDEHIENASSRILSNFSNPRDTRSRDRTSPVTKYNFLQTFARGSEFPPSRDVAVDPIVLSESDDEAKFSTEKPLLKPLQEVDDDGDDDRRTCANSCSSDVALRDSADDEVIPGFASVVDCCTDSKNHSLGVNLEEDDDDGSQISSSSSSGNSSEEEVSLEDKVVGYGAADCEIDGIKEVVNVSPDFILYEDLYSTGSQIIFSSSYIKLRCSTINGTGGTFKMEWATEDIMKIESCWVGKVETVMIKLLLKSKNSSEAGNTDQNPGVKLLKFAVYDPSWAKIEQSIKLLDTRYMDLWSTTFDNDIDNNENTSLGQDSFFPQKHYFPNFEEAFDEVIFPKGEPDAVSISKRDVELLQPETFINDTIIDFYIKYLKNKMPPNEQDRFHFFNSFFFRKLADLDRDPSSACDGKAAFQRVRKWTRKLNLFEKDYIFIPVNYSLHWSLIVICHPGEVISFKDEDIKESSKVPCILHMDSLKGSHKGLKNVFQSYLGEEWKERHHDVEDEVFSKFLQMRFVSLELPQQENCYDCGIFLLHYVECFLSEAPVNFNPFKTTKISNFLTSNWFPPMEASLKRSYIHNLIHDIFYDNLLKSPPDDCLDKALPEVPGIANHKEAGSPLGNCCLPIWHARSPSVSRPGHVTEIQSPEPGLGLAFEDSQGPVLNSNFPSCLQMSPCCRGGFLSPIEETGESVEETTTLDGEDSVAAILTPDLPSTSYISKDNKVPGTALQGLSVDLVEDVGGHTSHAFCCNTLETGSYEDQPRRKTEGHNVPYNTDAIEYLSTSSEEMEDLFVQDSQEENEGDDANERVKYCTKLRGNMNSVIRQILLPGKSMSLADDTLGSEKLVLDADSDEQDAKRQKVVMNVRDQRRRFTRSMSKKARVISCE